MKFTLAQAHIDHFNKTGAIEFEDLFSEKECSQLQQSCERALMRRLNVHSTEPLNSFSNENLFLHGRNMWKEGVEIKKMIAKKQIGEFAFQLFRKKPIKLAYDQYIHLSDLQDCPFPQSSSLQEISSIRPLIGALVVLLSPESLSLQDPLLPTKRGSALYLSGSVALPLSSLFAEKRAQLLVLAFTAGKALYCLEPKDPHTHSLKKEGVVFGDTATEEICPTLYNR